MIDTLPFPVVSTPRLEPEHLPPDRLTVAVFGPGHGEAVLVGLPDGRLGVLDGCAEREDPVAGLIDRIDAHRETPPRFAFVGLTHPHDDHYAGLGALMDRHQERIDLWWDTPIGNRHAKAVYEYVEKTRGGKDPGPDDWEKTGLLQIVDRMATVARERGRYFKRSGADLMWSHAEAAGHRVRSYGLGPAHADVHNAQIELIASIRRLAALSPPAPGIDPNYMSAATLIRWGKAGALLTGDLLNPKGRYLGWSAVRDAEPLREGPIQVVKCAHHASEGAHDDEIWRQVNPRLALVTPFKRAITDARGAEYPPRPEQIRALSTRCPVAVTSTPQWPEKADNPRPLGHAWSKVPPGPDVAGARTDVLDVVPREGRSALNNAVAVTLDATGDIVQVVLAGDADFYGT